MNMNANSELCKFTKKYLPLIKQQHDTMSTGDFEEWMKNTFSNVTTQLLKEVEVALKPELKPSSALEIANSLVPSIARASISTNITTSIDSLYIGRSDLRLQMEQRFAEDIAALTIFNRHAEGTDK